MRLRVGAESPALGDGRAFRAQHRRGRRPGGVPARLSRALGRARASSGGLALRHRSRGPLRIPHRQRGRGPLAGARSRRERPRPHPHARPRGVAQCRHRRSAMSLRSGTSESEAVMITAAPDRTYRYYEFVMAAFVTILICSNLIGPAKIAQLEVPVLGAITFGAGVLFFPISYVFGDVLTEVYGYARSRRVIWAGFAGLAFASFMSYVVVALPPAPFWKNQAAYEIAFGLTSRIPLASMIAYFCGEFLNSFALAKMKIMTARPLLR